jgi:hypothetical protein
MPTTTEPPYIHKSQGVASRNGTTTHVINFTTDGDAPFTPATGSLLLVFIGGGVTNAAAGWTEVEQPVATGELSAFTTTSAPTTSITVTHNAANYPCPWVVKEYPAGSVVTSSTNSNSASDTFPTASGLTGGVGNERVIEAAYLRIADGGESGHSVVWSGGYVEDADSYTAQATTDGAAFSSAHLINVTATSATPSLTATPVGTWTVGDREKIVLVVNAVAPASTTPFTRDYSSTWRVFNALSADYASTWRVLNGITRDYSSTWRVTNALVADYVSSWRVFNALTKDYVSTWRVLNALTQDYASTWRVLNSWTSDYASTWRVFNLWTRDYASTWDVLNGTAFTRDYVSTWRVFNAVSRDYASTWRVLGSFSRDYASNWRVLNALTRDYGSTWRVFQAWTRDYSSTWAVLGTTPSGLEVSVWNGTSLVPATISVWNGTTEIPATVESIVP